MDYIRQLNAFSNLSAGILSSNEVNVYLRLFWWNNRCCWTEWFETTDSRLQIETGIVSPNTIRAIRNSLRQKGFIDFIPGKRRSPTKYKIIDLSQVTERLPSSFMSTIDINTDIKTDINTDIKPDINADIKTDSIYKHKRKTETQTKTDYAAAAMRTREGGGDLAEVVRMFENNIHPITGEIERDNLIALTDEYGALWVTSAIEEAAISNGRNLRYITAVLERWKREGFKSPRKKGGTQYGINSGQEHMAGDSAEKSAYAAYFDGDTVKGSPYDLGGTPEEGGDSADDRSTQRGDPHGAGASYGSGGGEDQTSA
jgi:putative phage-associated protein